MAGSVNSGTSDTLIPSICSSPRKIYFNQKCSENYMISKILITTLIKMFKNDNNHWWWVLCTCTRFTKNIIFLLEEWHVYHTLPNRWCVCTFLLHKKISESSSVVLWTYSPERPRRKSVTNIPFTRTSNNLKVMVKVKCVTSTKGFGSECVNDCCLPIFGVIILKYLYQIKIICCP